MTSQAFKIATQMAAMDGAPKDYADQAATDAAGSVNLGYVERSDFLTIAAGGVLPFSDDFPDSVGEEILAVTVNGVAGDVIEVSYSLQVSVSKADPITSGIFIEGQVNSVCTRTVYHHGTNWSKAVSAKRSLELSTDGPVKISVRIVSSSNNATIYLNGSISTQAHNGAAFSNLTVKKVASAG